jgi:hypothetical protein
VSDTVGDTTLYTAGTSSENSLISSALPSHSRTAALRVPVTTLDSFFAARGRDPDVVKIDVEGAEFSVLRGADRIVRGDAIILCELHPYAWSAVGHDGTTLRAWLAERGRIAVDLRAQHDDDELRYGIYELRRAL